MKIIKVTILISLVLTAIGTLIYCTHDKNSIERIGGDFAGYWPSGHLLLNGIDPYSSGKILSVQKSLGWTRNDPLIMYNPPWVLTFLLPFCLSNFVIDKIIWLLFILSIAFLSVDRLWLMYGGTRDNRLWALLLMITYIPVLMAYQLGQIVFVGLLGLVGFLYFVQNKKWWAAGFITPLITVKPHAVYLFWFALLLWIVSNRLWPIFWGSFIAFLFIALIPLFFNLNIYKFYFINVLNQSYACHWATPTLGTYFRLYFGSQLHWLQYIPMLLGMMWFVFYWYKYRNVWKWEDHLPLLILVSLMTNFYIWPSDYVMILPMIIYTTAGLNRNPSIHHSGGIIVFYIIINVSALISTYFLDNHWFIWIPYALCTNYIFARKQLDAVKWFVPQKAGCNDK